MAMINTELETQGLKVGRGVIIDATVIRSSAKPPKGGEVSETDPEAGWTRKRGQYVHGYKAHVAVDDAHGLVQATVATGAEVHDSQVFGALLTGEESIVYADKAYDSASNRQRLAKTETKDAVLYKASKNKPLKAWQNALNKIHGAVRQGVERTFAHLKGIFGLTRARYKGWSKNQVHFDLLAIAYNLKRALKIMQTG